jgi:OOP family OmpA-OmpF porin
MILDRVADIAKRNEDVRVSVIGKTDRVGAPDANMALSEARAERVRNALIDSGVPSSRIDMSWVGERKQDMRTPDDIAEQRNRVVDVLVQLPN